MIINDLSYLAEATKETSVTGGYYYYYRPNNAANADASAVALGYNTATNSFTRVTVSQGYFSNSRSASYASAF